MELAKFPKMQNLYNIDRYEGIWLCENVAIQEKLHGTQGRIGFSKDGVTIGSRRSILSAEWTGQKDQFQVCSEIAIPVWEKLMREQTILDRNDITIFGEFVGPGIQKGIYYGDSRDFYAFDIVLINLEDGEKDWLSVLDLNTFCKLWGLNHVPLLGMFKPSMEKFNELYAGNSLIIPDADNNVIEGIVIKAYPMQYDLYGNPVYAKHKNDAWGETTKKFKEKEKYQTGEMLPFLTEARILSAINVIKESEQFNRSMSDMQYLPNIITKDIIEEESMEIKDEKHFKALRRQLSKATAKMYKKMLLDATVV